ncbi:exonuclease SbcCD subunit D C-terminal domain-containing protein [Moraxella nonliquefaciens]|uniref:exonuclease SbcCD subunit D C-terminal domain-containing protein n=2 Tax=Moraxella nonliquefaciens TaxID=478 RepID=UPI0024ADD8C3|nr:exonuclease SbcCD subunit D C-terminal domain-containing protein [Moraxella nonliquefaciens]
MSSAIMHTIPPKPQTTLRILHTSDWHIGKRLFNHSRYDEFEAFLDWLHIAIDTHDINALIVAGDIFDTVTPSNKAQELYYEFLAKVAKSCCQHVIITAGNHDSPTFLDAPKVILKTLNVWVIGQATTDINDEILLLKDKSQDGLDIVRAIILAVPYLRDKDVRVGSSFEMTGQRDHETAQGIAKHYQNLSSHALILQDEYQANPNQPPIPIIATGHLFCAGASISSDDDGMRKESFVGTLGQLPASIFADEINYVALGHIHAPQKVAGQDRIRYCGSPIAMGFGEIGKDKQVLIVDFDPTTANIPHIHTLSVPIFTKMVRLQGDTDTIRHALNPLIAENQTIYAEIVYDGQTLEPNFAKDVKAFLANTKVLPLNIQNNTQRRHILQSTYHGENLKQLTTMDVFDRLLDRQVVTDEEKNELKTAYQHIIQTIYEQDVKAE